MTRLVRYAWAFPATAVGLLLAAPCLAAGGTARVVDGVLEVAAAHVAGVLRSRGVLRGGLAISLGHVVLGTDARCLELTRAHERVHVRQYERWGALFFPLYALSSAAALARGRHPYTANRFEEAAFRTGSGSAGREDGVKLA